MCSLGLAALSVQAQELKANVKLELENVPAKVITYLINDATNEEIIDTLNVANNAISIQHKSDKAMTLYVISTDRKSIVNQVLLIPDSPITITAKNGGVLKIPYFCINCGFKLLGYKMGKNYKKLSDKRINKYTSNKEYWRSSN